MIALFLELLLELLLGLGILLGAATLVLCTIAPLLPEVPDEDE